MGANTSARARFFSRAASTYDDDSMAQTKAARRLFNLTRSRLAKRPPRILEVGCGTGTLSKMLLTLDPSCLSLADISEGMLDECKKRVGNSGYLQYIKADCESADFGEIYDLVVSSSAMQWFHDFRHGLLNLRQALTDDGLMAFFMFTAGTFEEIKNISGDGIPYLEDSEVRLIVNKALENPQFEYFDYRTHYKDCMSMLRSLKASGVSGTGNRIWTKGKLTRFIKEYTQKYSDNEGVYLSWHGIFVSGVK